MQNFRTTLEDNIFKASLMFDNSARRVRVLKCALLLLFGAVQMQRGVAVAADLDPTFGTGGKVLTSPTPGLSETATKTLIQPDGKIVVVGYARIYVPPTNPSRSDIWRFFHCHYWQ